MLGINAIQISQKMLNLVSEIDEFKGTWSALEEHTTSLQILSDVSSFGRNFKEITALWQNKPLDDDMLCKLHGVFTGAGKASLYRDDAHPLVIQTGEEIIGTLETAGAEEARTLMPRLLKWTTDSLARRDIHPLFTIAIFTAVFLQLCPFEKDNQKIARLLVVLLMFKAGYSYAPYSTLDALLQERAQNFHDVLTYTQNKLASGEKMDWDLWLEFFLRLLRDQKNKLQSRIEKSHSEITNMAELSTKILALFEKADRLSMKEIERQTRGKRSTLKLRLGELVDDGYLIRHGKARATWYARV